MVSVVIRVYATLRMEQKMEESNPPVLSKSKWGAAPCCARIRRELPRS